MNLADIPRTEVNTNVDYIRKQKAYQHLSTDWRTMQYLHTHRKLQETQGVFMTDSDFFDLCCAKCNYTHTHYNYIFLKLYKNEIDYLVFERMLKQLQRIEQGEINQHDASVEVGKQLAELYVDPITSCASESDATENAIATGIASDSSSLSWLDYKFQQTKQKQNGQTNA